MIQISVPETQNQLRPRITVFGVGGAGSNAVNNMVRANLEGVEFVVANTDAQSLAQNLSERKLQLGMNLTRGLGAGAKPEVGKAAAEEQIDEINAYLEGTNMCFITAGMGGGTGTGAAPVIARTARQMGILTVGVVTKPFHFEGSHRMRMAEAGIAELQQFVDTLIIIPNQNLFRIANDKTTFADAFRLADEVLHSGVRGVTDLMVMPGLINLDFADIRSVMSEMGKAMMGTGEASGEKRSINAAEAAIANPLLDDVSMKGARGVLINITGGYDMTLFEVDEAANRIREEVDPDANIIFGSTFDEKMEGKMRVSVVATGIDAIAEAAVRGSNGQNVQAQGQLRAGEQRKNEQVQQRPAAGFGNGFNAGFMAPPAAQPQVQPVVQQQQQKPVQQQQQPMAQPQQQYATQPLAQQQQQQPMPQGGMVNVPPSFSSPFSWGTPRQGVPSGMLGQQGAPSPAVALEQLLEKAKQAEAIAHANEQQMAQSVQSSPMVESHLPPPAGFVQPQPEKQPKRTGGLFSRIADFGVGRRQDTPQEQPPVQQQSTGQQTPNERPRLSDEDQALEIPAFLRQQNNR
jgi:cell division protein FtsZ